MKLKYIPVLAFAALTVTSANSHANGRKFLNIFRSCDWGTSVAETARANYDRLTTPLPQGFNRKIQIFKESDFRTKPYLREFEYVIVVNNANSVQQNEFFPPQVPLNLPSLSSLGINNSSNPDNANYAAQEFQNRYGNLAMQVRKFGAVTYNKVGTGKNMRNVPVPSNIEGAQIISVYRRGQLIHTSKVSTGRHEFELRGRNAACGIRPAESYYSITESGYYNFEELVPLHKSKSFDDADMPNSMFYIRDRGIALHAVTLPEKIAHLGKRASGGCTRMNPNAAASLYAAVEATKGARIPVIDIHGNPVLDAAGQLTYKSYEFPYGNPKGQQRSSYPSFSALLIVQPESPR